MASRRRRERDPGSDGVVTVPAQEDEADVLEEVGAEHDESGDLVVDEEKIREVGAVDAASVIENRRIRSTVTRKRSGEKRVRFNSTDLLTSYDTAIITWPPNTLDISVRRLTGSPVTHMIMNRPRSGAELYEAIKALHGQYEEAEYEVVVKDRTTKQFRVNARITMPDTRQAPQQGQPMAYIPPGYPPQPPAQPYPYPPQGYPPQAPYQQQPAPVAQQPASQPAPTQFAPAPAVDPMAMMDQLIRLIPQIQQLVQPPQPQQPQAVQPPPMPPPPPQSDPVAMMAWIQQMVQTIQQIQATAQHPATQGAPIPQQQPPQPQQPQMMGPSRPAPDGMIWTWEPGFGFVLTPTAIASRQEPARGPMQRGQRPPYYPQGDQGGGAPRYEPPPQQQPQAPKPIAEQWRESMSTLRTARHMVDELNALTGGGGGAAVQEEVEDNDSPIVIQDTGHGKLAFSREDGSFKWIETGAMALPGIAKWISEQADKISNARAERQQAQQPPRRQLPPGYVEVDANYQPPPGYTAVPVDQEQLPPPPEHVPPPISAPPGRRAWEEGER